ncbi:hypothetical protein GZH47_31855 (plasmid) [Paenibacillus rhizovicinus]|uniref:Uncharacterized protein n=1 Tax=Paenibacillus rhizovicinus TaxID=2704463 RepID=A0A6C0PAU1_9BACL|nr:hypothetical protein [Paenibacillus rhizovicinus]QHW35491.1 hypothetical protein GZH47_31855 [Paenibacillus rhizovicinus]
MKSNERVVHLDGGLSKYLLTSCGRRFIRCFTEVDGSYAEYFLETPDELHAFTSSEMITVTRQDGLCVGIYEGLMFPAGEFRSEGGNWDGSISIRR